MKAPYLDFENDQNLKSKATDAACRRLWIFNKSGFNLRLKLVINVFIYSLIQETEMILKLNAWHFASAQTTIREYTENSRS